MSDTSNETSIQISAGERTAVFTFFRRQWLEILEGKDQHAICTQLTAMLDLDLQFQTINHSRFLSEEASRPQSGLVHSLIDRGFIAHQVLAIRRITEDNQGSRKQDVYSLPRVIREVEEFSPHMTREVFVCADGASYEATFEEDQRSFHRHLAFDQMSNASTDSRAPDDTIDPSIFNRMRQALKSSDDVRRYANKMLAHAADPRNRPVRPGLTLSHFEKAYRDLIWLTDYLCSVVLCSAGHEFLLHYLCDPLEDLDQPICSSADLAKLRDYWNKRHSELESLEREAKGIAT